MISNDSFKGKTALISGGTSGINLGIAKVLAGLGADVAVFGRDGEKAKRAAAEIAEVGGGRALGLSADVRVFDAVDDVVKETVSQFGKLDIVIAGAAGNFPAPAIDISAKGFKTVVDIDLMGCYNVFRAGFDHRAEQSSFIAITAPQAVNPTLFQAHVCAAKAGINMLVKCLAMEWGQAGVRVNAISPGPIAGTEGMARLAPTPEAEARVEAANPLRRMGTPEEVGNLAAFISSDAAEYVNGCIMNVDGGTELGDASADTQTSWRNPS